MEHEVITAYDWFVITQTDHFYMCPHDLSKLDPLLLWFPQGQDFGGIAAGHLIVPCHYFPTTFFEPCFPRVESSMVALPQVTSFEEIAEPMGPDPHVSIDPTKVARDCTSHPIPSDNQTGCEEGGQYIQGNIYRGRMLAGIKINKRHHMITVTDKIPVGKSYNSKIVWLSFFQD